MWEYKVVVGKWVGSGAAVNVFCVVYGEFEGEKGEEGEERVNSL